MRDEYAVVRDLHAEALLRLGLAMRPRAARDPARALEHARPEVQQAADLLCQVSGRTIPDLARAMVAERDEEDAAERKCLPRPDGAVLVGPGGSAPQDEQAQEESCGKPFQWNPAATPFFPKEVGGLVSAGVAPPLPVAVQPLQTVELVHLGENCGPMGATYAVCCASRAAHFTY